MTTFKGRQKPCYYIITISATIISLIAINYFWDNISSNKSSYRDRTSTGSETSLCLGVRQESVSLLSKPKHEENMIIKIISSGADTTAETNQTQDHNLEIFPTALIHK